MCKYFVLCISFLPISIYSMQTNNSKLAEFATIYLKNKNQNIIPIFFVPEHYKEIIYAYGVKDADLINALNALLLKNNKSERQLVTQAFTL